MKDTTTDLPAGRALSVWGEAWLRGQAGFWVLSSPIVKRKDEAAHGEYRTKRVILDIYDAMQHAIETDQPYQTLLDPLPADPRVAHPPRNESDVLARMEG